MSDQTLERTPRNLSGLGIIFGLAVAPSGTLDLMAPWLLTACAQVILPIAKPLVGRAISFLTIR
jgi:hypothetical protein